MGKVEEYFFREQTSKNLARIIRLLETINKEMKHMSVELDALVLQVGETVGVEESVITLLQGIGARLDAIIAELEAAKVDTATVVKLREDLDVSEQAVAEAVANFTPPPVP